MSSHEKKNPGKNLSATARTRRLRERTNGNDALGTPEWLLEAVRRFAASRTNQRSKHAQEGYHTGRISLDPASSHEHNRLVQAERIYAAEDNGLDQDWRGDFVWLNPPFGKVRNKSVKAMWFEKAVEEYLAGNIDEAVVLLPAALDSKWFTQVKVWPRVDLHLRLRFRGATGPGAQTPICLVYLGGQVDDFFAYFRAHGDPVPGLAAIRPVGANLIIELFGIGTPR